MTPLRLSSRGRLVLPSALLAVTCLVFSTAAMAMEKKHNTRKGQRVKTNCDIQSGPCHGEVAGYAVRLEVLPRPVKAMADLTFKVAFHKALPAGTAPVIDLSMPAMDMGQNRVTLELADQNTYAGKGVIVR